MARKNNLTGLELRKACCEALGWHHGDRFWHHPWCGEENGCVTGCGVRLANIAGLPAIESEIGIAWPIFVEWVKKHKLEWQISPSNPEDRLEEHIVIWAYNPATEFELGVSDSTLPLAIARAIVEAEEKRK
jgi:hypothetical protein